MQDGRGIANGHGGGNGRGAGLGLAAGIALAGAAALVTRWQTRRAERRHPPSGRFISVDGVRLHYIDRGRGPPVVLIHGNVVTAEDFLISGVLRRLARHHRVIAFDRPGYGYSQRPAGGLCTATDQARLLCRAWARLGVHTPVVVGHSWGTLVALEAALRRPDQVAGLVLLSGYYRRTLRLDAVLASPPAIPVIGDVLRHTVSPLLGAALLPATYKGMFAPLAVPRRFKARFPHRFPLRPGQIRAEAQDAWTMAAAAARLQDGYGRLDMPVVIFAGSDDRVVDPDTHAAALHRAIPHSVLRIVAGAGHMLHHAVPDEVADAVETVSIQARRHRTLREPAASEPLAGLHALA